MLPSNSVSKDQISTFIPNSEERKYISSILGINLKIREVNGFFSENQSKEIISAVIFDLKGRIKKICLPVEQEKKSICLLQELEKDVSSKINRPILGKKLCKLVTTICADIKKATLLFNSKIALQKDLILTPAEMDVFGYRVGTKLMCHDYAFYMLNDLNPILEDELMLDPFNSSSWELDMPIEKFQKWGYEVQETPQSGDLVAYYKNPDYKNPAHLGIWTDEGKVRSKFGKCNVYLHDLDIVPLEYGNYIQFFRHPTPSAFVKYCLFEIGLAEKGLDNFSHVASASPLTDRGVAFVTARTIANENIHNTFLNSIYNIDYCNILKNRIVLKINLIAKELQSSENISEKQAALSAIRNAVFEAQAEVKPKI